MTKRQPGIAALLLNVSSARYRKGDDLTFKVDISFFGIYPVLETGSVVKLFGL